MNKKPRGTVILGMGSNRSWGSLDCLSILNKAADELENVLSSMNRASFYETEAQLVKNQNPFLNTAISGFFPGSPEELLEKIHQIEAQFGRDRKIERRWGERSLDIDILLFENHTIITSKLVIPHPRLEERRFALEPLLELWPKARSPLTGIPYGKICCNLPDQGVRRRLALPRNLSTSS